LTLLSGRSRETSPAYFNDSTKETNPYAVWQYTVAGRGRIDTKEKSLDLLPGSLMILSVPGPHAYYLPADSDFWDFVFLVFIGREAVRITRMIEQRTGCVIAAGAIPATLSLLYEVLEKLFSGEIRDPFANSSYTYRLCMSVLKETAAANPQRINYSFTNLRAFLKEHIHRDISVEEMAEVMGFSRSHFTRIFCKEMGISPRLYLEDLRLKTAIDIFGNEGCSIKEAAMRCGIYDVNYFCRIFKKRFGLSPGKYREKNRPGPSGTSP
jgi:AraC-like DNA-binding protein